MGMVVPSGGRGSRRGHGRRWWQGGAGAGEVAPERALQSRRVVVGVGGEKAAETKVAATAEKLTTGSSGCSAETKVAAKAVQLTKLTTGTRGCSAETKVAAKAVKLRRTYLALALSRLS